MGFREGTYLFRDQELDQFLGERRAAMLAEVERIPTQVVACGDVNDLAARLAAEHSCQPAVLRKADLHLETEELEMSVDEIPDGRLMFDADDGATVRGTRYSWHVPFDGEGELFRCAGPTWSTNMPQAEIENSELVFARRAHQQDATQLKTDFERAYSLTEQHLREINARVERFNTQLVSDAHNAIVSRRERLVKAGSIATEMGYPLKRRADAPPTYSVSLPKKRDPISTAKASPLEPAVAMRDYDEILRIMESMALMLERSPHAFRQLHEEELRFFFLVYLNGQYDGGATGETFNFRGKTDILVTANGRNVFIAECKFWSGPAGFTETINQLLGYLSWRDTKTAILVFNRGTQMSTVVRQIPGLLAAHPQFVNESEQAGETRFRAKFRQPNDPDREVIVTVLVFDVPGEAA